MCRCSNQNSEEQQWDNDSWPWSRAALIVIGSRVQRRRRRMNWKHGPAIAIARAALRSWRATENPRLIAAEQRGTVASLSAARTQEQQQPQRGAMRERVCPGPACARARVRVRA